MPIPFADISHRCRSRSGWSGFGRTTFLAIYWNSL